MIGVTCSHFKAKAAQVSRVIYQLILAVANRIGLPIRGYLIALHPIA
jgi:hypothetical protein